MRQDLAALAARWVEMAAFWRRAGIGLAVLTTAAWVVAAPADLARGLTWLQSQVQSNGTLIDQASAGAQGQAQCQAALTLNKLASGSASITALIAAMDPAGGGSTEQLACWLELRQLLGQAAPESIDARRVPDTGYGAYAGFGVANALDSGWALSARLKTLRADDMSVLLGWLQSIQAADGSFAAAGRPDLLATAAVLRGLNDGVGSNGVAAAIARKAATWLLSKRVAGGGWSDDTAVTALVFEAVHPYSATQAGLASEVEAFLLARQLPDGSWGGDAYATAAALRALALALTVPVDASAAILRGVVTLAVNGQPAAGVVVRVQPVSGPEQSATTSQNGEYAVLGIAPGGATLTATLQGHQAASTTATLVAGKTTVFSPSLYAMGATVGTGARVSGAVVAFGTNTPLSGVAVTANSAAGGGAASGVTDAQGRYALDVPAADLGFTFSLAAYQTVSMQVVATHGATLDLGRTYMQLTRQTSSVRGSVRDFQGQAIAGASVQWAQGSAVTNSAGAYVLDGVAGTPIALQASATGYVTRQATIAAAQPGDHVQDFVLPSSAAGYLALSGLQVSAPAAGLRQDVTATVVVSNPSSQTAASALVMEVVDPAGRIVASLHARDALGGVLPVVTMAAGEQASASFKWNTGSFPAGTYALVAKLVVPDSYSYQNPTGLVLGSLRGQVEILASPHFAGSVSGTPPVLSSPGTTPVALSAVVQNDGNLSLPAQSFLLSVFSSGSTQGTFTQTVNAAAMPAGRVQELSFGAWTPAAAGNYRLELGAPSTPGSLITGTVYVGPAAAATFTVDKPLVPPGTQSVRATVQVTGRNLVGGVIADPYAPLIQQALTKSVAYADNQAYAITSNPGCYQCHVQTQAVVGGERSLRYTPGVAQLRRAVMSWVQQNANNDYDPLVGSTGAVSAAAKMIGEAPSANRPTTQTSLALWATAAWSDPETVNLTKLRFARFLMDRQQADGSWIPDDASTWWRTRTPLTAVNLASLHDVRKQIELRPQTMALKNYVPVPLTGGIPLGQMRTTADAQGNLYAAILGGGVWSIAANGMATEIIPRSTLGEAWGAQALPGGRLAIAASNGIWIREANGTLARLATGYFYTVRLMANGDLLASAPWWDTFGRLYRITPGGTVSVFAQHNWVAGLNDFTIMADGGVLVLGGSGTKHIVQFNASGQLVGRPVAALPKGSSANSILPYKGGYLVAGTAGLWFYNKDWVAQRWKHDWTYGITEMPDGRLLITGGTGLLEVRQGTLDAAAALARVDASAGAAADWLKGGTNFDPDNNIDVAFRLMGLDSAKKYFAGTARAAEFDALIASLGSTLRGRQREDGGWYWTESGTYPRTDSMVTAMAGVALEALHPSPNAPEVRKAIQLLLANQRSDGTWISENGVAATALLATTWVEIWLPTMLDRLAVLEASMHLTFPANVTLGNASPAPSTSAGSADGATSHAWNLTLPENGQQISLDLTLAELRADEQRPVALEANLQSRNTYTGGTVTSAITIPTVSVSPTRLAASVQTDKPQYTETDQALFTATVANNGTEVRVGQVKFSVYDASGGLVHALPLPATVSVPVGGSATSVANWPVNSVLAGSYQLRADLLSPAGVLYSSATATFAVSTASGQAGATRITADRATYSAAQSVQLSSRVANLTGNAVQENLQAITTVTGASGQEVFSRTEAISQLVPGGQAMYAYSIAAAGLPAGAYSATVKLAKPAGTVLAQSAASFTVLGADQTGVGVIGQLQVSPARIVIGRPVQFTVQVTNTSGTNLSKVPVTVRLVEPTGGVLIATLTGTVGELPAGQTRSTLVDWTALGADGQLLVASATALVGTNTVSLAQANFRTVGMPGIAAEPPQLTFTPIHYGESATRTVTLSSLGSAPARTLTFSIAGPDASQFALPQGGCAGQASLPIGATCTLTISYRPETAGTHAGEVRIAFADAEPVALAFTGTAKQAIFAGTLRTDAPELEAGANISLLYSVANPSSASSQFTGNVAVSNGAQQVASWPLAHSVAGSATHAGSVPFSTPEEATFTAILSQVVGTDTKVLATTTFTVVDPAMPLAVTAQRKPQARVLVLLSCPLGQGNKEDAACLVQRSQAIASYLQALGVVSKIVTTGQTFADELRCGSYNTYWISGGALKLDPQVVAEVREAVNRGEALIMDGVHDSRNQLLHGVAGVKEIGKLPQSNQLLSLATAGLFGAGTLATVGQPTRFDLHSPLAQGQALFTQASGNQAPPAAIISNEYGLGRSLLYAFDLAATLATDPGAIGAPLRSVMTASASHLASGTPTLTVGDLALVSTSVGNLGTRTASLRVDASLPPGLTTTWTAPPAQLTVNTDGSTAAVWTLTVPPGAAQDIDWQVRALTPGSYSVPVAVYTLPRPGSSLPPKLGESTAVTLEVRDGASILQQALAAAQAVQPSANSEKNKRSKMLDAVAQAMSLHGSGQYQQALVQWAAAADGLLSITSVDVTAARLAVALAMEASSDAWCMQRCGRAACE